jgi:hypothetical protein
VAHRRAARQRTFLTVRSRRGRQVSFVALLVLTGATLALGGCGGASSSSRKAEAPSGPRLGRVGGYSRLDGDSDVDDLRPPAREHYDDAPLLGRYGGRASPADAAAIAGLVKTYYAASAAGEAARACSLLSTSLASGLAATEGGTGTQGSSAACAKGLAPQLEEQHARLLGEDPASMRVEAVYAKGDSALAVFAFKTAPESEIVLAREGGAWKIDALFGSYMP